MSSEPQIIYVDEALVIIAKPALVHSVSQSRGSPESIARWLTTRFVDIQFASEKIEDGGLINRLDYETSGILVAARERHLWLALREQFGKREISKTYLAVVSGHPQPPLEIAGYLGNRHRGSKKVTLLNHAEERFQYTQSHITKVLSYDSTQDRSIIEVSALTGARHQIRAHCASIGHPLVGDILYGSKAHLTNMTQETPPFALHASELTFLHPLTAKTVTFHHPTPEYLLLQIGTAGAR